MDTAQNKDASEYDPNRQRQPDPSHKNACDSMPDLTRLRYFYGQMLGASDLQTEQDYFRKKLKLLNRCLHGYGTVCGLKVGACKSEPDCDPAVQPNPNEPRALVQIECGLALDCEGNELVVHDTLTVDLWKGLSDTEKRLFDDSAKECPTLYLTICYCVQPIDPVRPVLPDACTPVSECVYSKLRDSVRIKVTTERPHIDHCRNNCCQLCADNCLLLAAIDFKKGEEVTDEDIRNDVRRWVTLYKPVTINGINWVHGADHYTIAEATKLLQEDGLKVRFSRPVLEETITNGLFDVWVLEGGKGRSGAFYYIAGEWSYDENSRCLTFTQNSDESLQHGDRVLITVRAEFILDECCRPVDGNHVGGRVPLLEDAKGPAKGPDAPQTVCLTPPNRYGPWTSGNGSPGGNFESWFYIDDPPQYRPRKQGGQETVKPSKRDDIEA